MATQESMPQALDYEQQGVYETLDPTFDPLELASQALLKLKVAGLRGYIEPSKGELVADAVEPFAAVPAGDVVVSTELRPLPQRRIEQAPSPAVDLDEYRQNKIKGLLSNKRHLELIASAQGGDQGALNSLWTEAQKIAKYVAFLSKTPWSPDEKIQTCLEVLPGAVARYNPERGVAFKSYLITRMLGALKDSERSYGRSNGLSRGDYDKVKKALKAEDPQEALHQLTQPYQDGHGRMRPGLEVAGHLVLDGQVKSESTSLEALVHESENSSKQTRFEPSDGVDIFKQVAGNLDIEKLRAIVKKLPERERIAVLHCYGLFGAPELGLEEVGKMFGVSGSRVSQHKTKGVELIAKSWDSGKIDATGLNRQNRLDSLQKIDRKLTRDENLQKLRSKIGDLSGALLSDAEQQVVFSYLNDWVVARRSVSDRTYELIERELPGQVNIEQLSIANAQSSRRQIGIKGTKLALLVNELNRSDFIAMIDVERQISELGGFSEPDPDFESKFSEREQQVLASIDTPNAQLAYELGISESTVRTHKHKMIQKLGLTSEHELAYVAASKGVIDMNRIPSGRTMKLSDQGWRIVTKFWNIEYKEAAEALNISVATLRTHWHHIYEKMGLQTRTMVVMCALKDGAIKPYEEKTETND